MGTGWAREGPRSCEVGEGYGQAVPSFLFSGGTPSPQTPLDCLWLIVAKRPLTFDRCQAYALPWPFVTRFERDVPQGA
jgi:hypothetical protein